MTVWLSATRVTTEKAEIVGIPSVRWRVHASRTPIRNRDKPLEAYVWKRPLPSVHCVRGLARVRLHHQTTPSPALPPPSRRAARPASPRTRHRILGETGIPSSSRLTAPCKPTRSVGRHRRRNRRRGGRRLRAADTLPTSWSKGRGERLEHPAFGRLDLMHALEHQPVMLGMRDRELAVLHATGAQTRDSIRAVGGGDHRLQLLETPDEQRLQQALLCPRTGCLRHRCDACAGGHLPHRDGLPGPSSVRICSAARSRPLHIPTWRSSHVRITFYISRTLF